jgi:hypothetical protein
MPYNKAPPMHLDEERQTKYIRYDSETRNSAIVIIVTITASVIISLVAAGFIIYMMS